MKNFVIHFPHRKDREELFLKEAEEQGFQFEFVTPVYHVHAGTSLLKTYQKIIFDNYCQDEICLMEDDIHFCDKGAFDYFVASKPESFDVYLGGFYDGRLNEETKKIIRSWSGTHLWIISKKFYDTVLAFNEQGHIDRLMFAAKADVHCCYPFAAIQHIGYSDVQKRIADHSWYINHKKLFIASEAVQHTL